MPSAHTVATQSPVAITSTSQPDPSSGRCLASVVDDSVGHGQTFRGEGFRPDVPLSMTLSNDKTSTTLTEADFPELRSDVRGAFEIHLYASRADIGASKLEVSGGGCVASYDFEVSADRFPEADCEAAEATTPTGSDAADAYARSVLDDGPLTYWRFEESTGSPEDSVNGASAEMVGSPHLGEPGFVTGSRSILLDDDDGDWSDWLDIPNIELVADFTIEAWYRFCGEFVWFQDALIGQGGPGPDINFFEWRARLWTGTSDELISSELIRRSGWQHLAVTRSTGDLEMFQDGHSVGTGTYEGSYPISAVGAGESGTFGGWLDEVAIYDHALAAEAIAARAAMGR
jgi:Concanavalin A-like lectin/glucanases superfamily